MRSFDCIAASVCIVALVASGCRESRGGAAADEHGDEHGHDSDHAHEAEPKTLALTVWSDPFEIFLEHRPLVAGVATRFATHVSDLASGQARSAGPITFRFEQPGAAPIVIVDPAPARAGIYTPEITLPRPGAWKASLAIPTEASATGSTAAPAPDATQAKVAIVALPDFTVFATAHDAEHAELPEPPDGVAFLKEQQWKLGTRIAPVARRHLVEEARVPAVVSAPPSARAHVTPPLAGRLIAAPQRKWPELGAHVSQGEVLAWVEPPLSELVVAMARADAESAQAKLAVEQADAALRRMRTLADQKARTPRELEESEFALRAAQSRLDAALAVQEAYRRTGPLPPELGAGASLPRLALVAPIEGVVTRIDAVAGEYVGADAIVFSLLDARVLHVEVRVPEVDLPRLGEPLEAAFSVPGTEAPPSPITGAGGGRLAWRDVEIDAATRTLTLHFELPDRERRLSIGQSLVAHLTTSVAADALALPESAIVDEDARPVAFVQISGETFEKRELVVGIRDRGFVEVKSGLAEGDRVVVDGAYAVRLASVSTTIPSHGHAH